jgi:phosphoglycolate phosphatase-like HAD superfamily hydrolase
VFTGKGKRTASISLEQLEIAEYFDLVVSGSDVVRHKPHPEGIQRILSDFGVSPGQTLMVGDSVSDIVASRAAGVAVASVLWDCYDRDSVLREKVDFRFEQVAEMKAWFDSQFES